MKHLLIERFLWQFSHAGVASASHRIFFYMTFLDIISIYVRINITYNLTGKLKRPFIKHYQYNFNFIFGKKLAEY